MNELALFSGAGGGILGSHLLGWKTVCAVEIERYARDVLMARQNDGILDPFPIWDDVRTFDGRPWRGIVDVVSGGFPCQDISSAGKGAGLSGKNSGLWREMARIISEVQPRSVFAENSPLLRKRGLNIVIQDLAEMGYSTRWGIIGAGDVGAPHERERMWIVAHAIGYEQPRCESCSGKVGRVGRFVEPLAWEGAWEAALAEFRRMDAGLAARVDRTDTIRNGQVPAVAALAWNILSENLQKKPCDTTQCVV